MDPDTKTDNANPGDITSRLLADLEAHKKILAFFRRAFSGNPDGFYLHLGGIKYRAVDGAPTDDQIVAHLTGRGDGLLSAPIRADGTVRFAAIDVDRHNAEDPAVKHAELSAAVVRLGLPLIVTRSKRDGGHLWLFFKEKLGFSAEQAQRLMSRFATMLGLDAMKVEIFPKQKKGGGPHGSGINLPYRGSERWAVGPGGEALDIVDFFELVQRHLSYGAILARHHLKPTDAASSSEPQEDHPLTLRIIRSLHKKNLASLRSDAKGSRNDTLNTVAFFVARAFSANALEGTADEIKGVIRQTALASGLGEGETAATLASGWESGLSKGALQLREETEAEQAVWELNEKFFVIKNYGNKCRVAWLEEEVHPELKGRLKLGHQSFADFQNSLLNKLVPVIDGQGRTDYEPKGHLWLRHPARREYWRVVFAPEQDVQPELLNLWQGFAFNPQRGDCSLYLKHLREIICSGNEEHYQYTLKWMALGVQRPWERGHVALVWRGDKGPGKNLAADAYGKLFGGHFMTITNSEHLVGRFNAHLRAKCVLIANEAFYAGNKQHEATLKGLITDAVLPIEQKFVDAETDVNLLHIIVLSNNDWVVPTSDRERRFFMVDVSDARIGDYPYFAAIQRQLEEHAGYAALLHHLLHVDLEGFNVRDVPKTEALRSQMAESLTGVDAVWFECLQRGEIPGVVNKDGTVSLRGTHLIDWAEKKKRRDWHSISIVKLGFLLGINPRGKYKGMGFKKEQQPTLFGTAKRHHTWEIPTLQQSRELWSKKRFEVAWDTEVTNWQSVEMYEYSQEPRDS